MFERIEIFTIGNDGHVDVQGIDAIRIAGRASVQVRVGPDLTPEDSAAALRQIANFIEGRGPHDQTPTSITDAAA